MALEASTLLRTARARAALSQRALAARARTTQCVVARIELGQTSPAAATLDRLLAAAGFELAAELQPIAELDEQLLDDVPRILRLAPEARLRELRNVDRFVTGAVRRG
jgi:transcriptional regulator with XRE-family HTH domain